MPVKRNELQKTTMNLIGLTQMPDKIQGYYPFLNSVALKTQNNNKKTLLQINWAQHRGHTRTPSGKFAFVVMFVLGINSLCKPSINTLWSY